MRTDFMMTAFLYAVDMPGALFSMIYNNEGNNPVYLSYEQEELSFYLVQVDEMKIVTIELSSGFKMCPFWIVNTLGYYILCKLPWNSSSFRDALNFAEAWGNNTSNNLDRLHSNPNELSRVAAGESHLMTYHYELQM